MGYLDTLRLRNIIADGNILARETVLDLLTRVERYQDKELRQLALDKHPAEMPDFDPNIPGLGTGQVGLFRAWEDDTQILNVITQLVEGATSYAAARGLKLDPTTFRLEFATDDTLRLVCNTKPEKDQK